VNLYRLFISEFYWLHLAHYYQFLNMSLRQTVDLKPTSQFSLLRKFHVHEADKEQPAVLADVVRKSHSCLMLMKHFNNSTYSSYLRHTQRTRLNQIIKHETSKTL